MSTSESETSDKSTLQQLKDNVNNPEDLEQSIEDGKREEREQQKEQTVQASTAAATEDWIQSETTKEKETIPFKGKDFEWAEPGVIHYKKTMEFVSEVDPEAFDDIDEDDDEQVREAMDETIDQEGVKSIIGLFDHTLRTLCELCDHEVMGDETIPDGEDLPRGALQWGRFKEPDLTPLFRQVVVERYQGDDEDGDGRGN